MSSAAARLRAQADKGEQLIDETVIGKQHNPSEATDNDTSQERREHSCVQQAPPAQVINGLALLLSIYVMFPTGVRMYTAAQSIISQKNVPQELFSPEASAYILSVSRASSEPLTNFLKTNSLVRFRRAFFKTVYRLLPENYRDELKADDFLILVPSFIMSQLKSAFEIGTLIFIPFFIIDLVVSNILLAMGMMMLSPTQISTPLKLFLLVMLDGWTVLIEGLVVTFR